MATCGWCHKEWLSAEVAARCCDTESLKAQVDHLRTDLDHIHHAATQALECEDLNEARDIITRIQRDANWRRLEAYNANSETQHG